MAVINTNYLALVSQNNLTKSQGSLGQAIERLSSGLRINSAKDDAAGQAIANRFTANIRGLTQAARNSNDGISIAQTTEGALNEINNNLQRIRELADQAANGSNSASDLKSIQAEISQRLEEIDRVSDQTQFNGVRVLAKDSALIVQVGANDFETITVNLKEISATTLNVGGINVEGDSIATYNDLIKDFGATGTLNYNAENIKGSTVAYTIDAATNKVTSGSSTVYVDNVTGKLTATKTNTGVAASAANLFATTFASTAVGDKAIIGGIQWTVVGDTPTGGTSSLKGQFRATVDGRNITATINGSTISFTGGNLYFNSESAGSVSTAKWTTRSDNAEATLADIKEHKGILTGGSVKAMYKGSMTPFTVDSAGNVLNGSALMYVRNAGSPNAELVAQDDANLATYKILEKVDKALSQVDALRSELGAIQNRFESTIANLNNTINNLSAARSRIEDADYAVEVSNMTRAQILQQAGTAVLAQANQVPQTMLSLLS